VFRVGDLAPVGCGVVSTSVGGCLHSTLAGEGAESLALVPGTVDVDLVASGRCTDSKPPGIAATDGKGDASGAARGPALPDAVVWSMKVDIPLIAVVVQPRARICPG
jgi:hypothetical protein